MQRKILPVIIICISTANFLNAQIRKGAVLLGGQFSFYGQSGKNTQLNTAESKNVNFGISPTFGKAIKENLVIGADINFTYGKNQPSYYYTMRSNSYGLGVFVRKYKELGKGFYLFGQSRAGYFYNTQKATDKLQPANNYSIKGYNAQVGIYPGVSYSASRKLQLEAGFNNLAYIQFDHSEQTINTSPETSFSSNSFSVGSTLSSFAGFTVGFRILLN